LLDAFSPPPAALREFANSERRRFEGRIGRLAPGSALRSYEEEYGLELGGDAEGPRPSWSGPSATHAYPSSVRARRIAVAIRCGRRDLGPQLARAARAVVMQLEVHLLGNHLLENAIGLVCAASVARGAEADLWWRIGSRLLGKQLAEQFLPDGGHFERSASYHLALTAGLLEAIGLAEAGGRIAPHAWHDTASKAIEWARAVRAPDGAYPLFNDAAYDAAPSIDSVEGLARACRIESGASGASATEPWFRHLPDTGWIVAGSRNAWLCVDAGPDGAPYQPGHVHADALTFELWIEGERAIVDYGVESYTPGDARAETRATRSHNTVEVDGLDSCEVWGAFRVGRRSRSRVHSLVRNGTALEADLEHDGYTWLPGRPVHRRRLSFADGLLRVTDEVTGGAHSGVSRVRVASSAKHRVEVAAPMETAKKPGHHCENFAEPREAVVEELPVVGGGPAEWTIRWR
jgi:uncharacterized heparinase superfamily protein